MGKMLYMNDNLFVEFDRVRKELQEIAEKRKIDLSKIRITNPEAEKIRKRYTMFYN